MLLKNLGKYKGKIMNIKSKVLYNELFHQNIKKLLYFNFKFRFTKKPKIS